MRYLTLLAALSVWLALPSIGFAQGWVSQPDGSRAVSSLMPNKVAHYDFTVATDSSVLDVTQCETIHVYFDPDEDGTDTGAEVYIRESGESGITCASMTTYKEDINGDGFITAADERTLTGAAGRIGYRRAQTGPYICVDITAVAGTPDDARVTVTCKGG